ncbi:MAG: flagellar biosynthesis anti-sigma factor FlgM [Actinomycetota bacterium]|nr:flagellar biosynthesis anti-sigma factor FlgM [Actinomycetota bacterium]
MTNWRPARDDGRDDRIRSVKERVERGEYRVPAASIADAVIAWYHRVDPDELPTTSRR